MSSRFPISRLFLVVVVLLSPLSVLAADEVGHIRGNGSMIEWSLTRSGHASVTLYVQAPDGTMYEKTFRGNQNPNFRTSDLKGGLQDGVYSYELRVTPAVSDSVKAALKAARAAGDDARIAEILKANGLQHAIVQSGAFGMLNGAFLDPAATESDANDTNAARAGARPTSVATNAARKPEVISADDFVIPDDLIVQSSTCTGFDCVDGEVFDFDTLRLKENNLRIHFLDTSTSAGFPANDWRIVANDSGSGGANKFVIEDSTAVRNVATIEAGAPANTLYLDSSGNVGITRANPVLDLHIATGDTPAIRLEQTEGGFGTQTWDVAGNEANFFVRDVTGGSRLPFRIRPGATTSAIDISSDGDVGINVASPNANARMDVADSTQIKARIAFTGQEFFAASNSSTDGIALLLGVNRTNNRQLWIGDTAALTQNTGNPIVRIFPGPSASDISSIATDGVTTRVLTLNQNGGNVGVGTSSPASRFHVNGGDVRVSGGSFIDDGVTLIAPDYVFEDSYSLMPVPELAAFVKENRHLPGVPSAKDIAKNGLNVSKFQMSLLEKVEELTLYTVAQHEQIAKLMERIATLEAAIAQHK